ncbi:uncharacterized protein LOC105202176 isoform X2 [Solenopsis invicta]|uniref:uncharacterized protein LOC105202176 isoform X2 n=1 Tax=Solenopsis invicta TaxID=13686 RepID=UPI00193D2A02|nr:uncharacterized protein LOC105202176 isoform X2 [Solenopsis invicta]
MRVVDVSNEVNIKGSKRRGISYQDGSCVLLDRQCRARRKSQTSLKIFKETHRIVPKPRTKRQDGGEEERQREKGKKSVATGVRIKIPRGTHIPRRIFIFSCRFPCLKQCVPKAPYHSPVRCRVC